LGTSNKQKPLLLFLAKKFDLSESISTWKALDHFVLPLNMDQPNGFSHNTGLKQFLLLHI